MAIPALLVAMRPRFAAVYATVAAGSLIGTAVWALIETHAAGGLFYFAHQNTGALLHLATSTIWLSGAAVLLSADRSPERWTTRSVSCDVVAAAGGLLGLAWLLIQRACV